MLADAHAHISDYSEEGLSLALGRAKAKGVEMVVGLGADVETSRRTVSLAKGRPMVYAAVGFHPWFLKGPFTDRDLEDIRALAKEEKVSFIGEIGLDINRNADRFEEQKRIFAQHLDLAKELDLPINVHCRGADRELLELMERQGMPRRGGVAHSYSGGAQLLQAYLDLGFYISIGRGGLRIDPETEKVVKAVPPERLLLETDSSAASSRQENAYEPASVSIIAENVARVRGVSPGELGDVTTANLKKLMRIQ
ncbi:MAG: TatD family hydrolase [Chloroflexi bacterium]|nr:TatD family hydrolase [Chloroflexota bacterium]